VAQRVVWHELLALELNPRQGRDIGAREVRLDVGPLKGVPGLDEKDGVHHDVHPDRAAERIGRLLPVGHYWRNNEGRNSRTH